MVAQAGLIEQLVEGKVMQLVEEAALGLGTRLAVVGVEEGEEHLEHTRGSARGGYHLVHRGVLAL